MKGNEIEIEGKRFAIHGDINFEYYSPFIDGEEIIISSGSINPRGTYTLPFELVGTDELAEITRYAQLLQSKGPVVAFENTTLRSNGVRIEKGNVDLQRITANLNNRHWQPESIFYNDAARFGDLARETNLRELHLHDDIIVLGNSVRGLLDTLRAHFTDTIVDYQTTGPFDSGELIGFNVTRGNDVWRWIYDNKTFDDLQITTAFATLINQGIDPWDVNPGYYSDGPALGFFIFPPYYADFDGVEGQTLNHMLNYWDPVEEKFIGYTATLHTTGEDYVEYTPLRNQMVPMYYWHKVLVKCFETYGYMLEGDLLEDEQFLKGTFTNTYSILKEEILQLDNMFSTGGITNALYCQNQTVISSKNHLPDMTIVDFLHDIMLKFNCFFDIKDKKAVIRNNKLRQPANEYSDVHPDIIIEASGKKGVTIKYNFPTGDGSYQTQIDFVGKKNINTASVPVDIIESVDDTIVGTIADGRVYLQNNVNAIHKTDVTVVPDGYSLVVNNLVAYNTGKGKEFTSELVPVEMGIFPYNGINAYLPWFKHAPTYYDLKVFYAKGEYNGGTDQDEFTELDFGTWNLNEGEGEKKVALYHGLQTTLDMDTAGYTYPYMSFHNYAPGASSGVKLGNWHFGWIGGEGLIATFWKEFVNIFNKSRKVTFLIPVTFDKIKKHDWSASDIIRSRRYYVSAIKFKQPDQLNGAPTIFECYEL